MLSDEEFYRKLGITVEPKQEPPASIYLVISAWLFSGVVSVALWYGIVRLVVKVIRAL